MLAGVSLWLRRVLYLEFRPNTYVKHLDSGQNTYQTLPKRSCVPPWSPPGTQGQKKYNLKRLRQPPGPGGIGAASAAFNDRDATQDAVAKFCNLAAAPETRRATAFAPGHGVRAGRRDSAI